MKKRAYGSKSLYSNMQWDYDYLIVGSGFGGSVSALRLTQKGYTVLVVEKGKRWRPEQFPESNWQLRKWLWWPLLRFRGIFKITIMRHVGILSGVGVGGGSLMYANTLPARARPSFQSGSWAGIAPTGNQNWIRIMRRLSACSGPRKIRACMIRMRP
jgi:cholesterol oxidase